MAEILQFFKTIEIWIYLLLGLAGLFYVFRFLRAWDEMKQAAFGLEHESAQQRLNRAATGLVFLVALAVIEFVLVSFIIPIIPESTPLPTPTLDLLATPTVTIAAPSADTTQTPDAGASFFGEQQTAPAETGSAAQGGCVVDQINISEPQNNAGISGTVTIKGTADVPGFGFYKFEFSSPGQPDWTAIQAWTQPKKDADLGLWDTSRLVPGLYLLRLVVVDNQGKALPPCVVQVSISGSPAE